MPGNVKTIDQQALEVFPESLFSQYQVAHNWRLIMAEYPDGSAQRGSAVTTSKRTWRFSKKLTKAQLGAVRAFYFAHVGQPFLFRDVHTGIMYAGVFKSPWYETGGIGRSTVSLTVEEVY